MGFFIFEITNMQVDIVRRLEGIIYFASISSRGYISIVSCIFRCRFVLQGRAEPDLVLSHDQQACICSRPFDDVNHLDFRVAMRNDRRWEKEQISSVLGVLKT